MKYVVFLGFFLFSVSIASYPVYGAQKVEIISSYLKKIEINGQTFIEKEELFNGITKRVWAVDGKPVTHRDFEDALLDAEREARREELHYEQARRQAEVAFNEQAMLAGNKKMLALAIQKIDRQLTKLNLEKFGRFLLFDETNFGSRAQFDTVVGELLPKARRLYEKSDRVIVSELMAMLEQLEDIPKKLQNLFQKTVTYAIETCDDTKVLKELLDIVSQAQ